MHPKLKRKHWTFSFPSLFPLRPPLFFPALGISLHSNLRIRETGLKRKHSSLPAREKCYSERTSCNPPLPHISLFRRIFNFLFLHPPQKDIGLFVYQLMFRILSFLFLLSTRTQLSASASLLTPPLLRDVAAHCTVYLSPIIHAIFTVYFHLFSALNTFPLLLH